MGQYYKLTCPETGTHVCASAMGSFVKAYEQVWSPSQPAALAFLCSAGRGTHPRDLPWAPQGLWAGRMPLMVGDYAEDGDLIGRETRMGQPEGDIYDNATDKRGMLTIGSKRKRLKDLSMAFIPIYERTHAMRAVDLREDGSVNNDAQWWSRDFFPAKKTEAGWELDLDNVAEEDKAEANAYYERCGAFKKTGWQRPAVQPGFNSFKPLADVPDVIPSQTEGAGGAMLWVNLDRREFVDPAAMGDVPDLVGVMNGDSARAVLGMIVHHARRGGGDLGDLGPIAVAGRWRGDRIVLLGPEGFKPPMAKRITQEEVLADFLDATRNAEAFIKCNDWFDSESFEVDGDARATLTKDEREILSIAMQSPSVKEALKGVGPDAPLHTSIIPPVRFAEAMGGQKPPKGPLDLAPSFEIYINGGKIFLDADTRAEINAQLAALPVQEAKMRIEPSQRYNRVYIPGHLVAEMAFRSNHELISAFKAAA
jgi:hypothetical protein